MIFSTKKAHIEEEKCDLLVVGLYTDEIPTDEFTYINEATEGLLSDVLKEEGVKGKAGEMSLVRTSEWLDAKRVLVIGLGKQEKCTQESIREASATAHKVAKRLAAKTICFAPLGVDSEKVKARTSAKAITEGFILGGYVFSKYKKEKKPSKVSDISIVVESLRDVKQIEKGIEDGKIYAEATMYARDLVNEPAEHLRPLDLVERAKEIVKGKKDLKIKIFDEAKLKSMKAGGILSIAKGSDHPPFMVHMIYKPEKAKKRIALVGKAVTFDSGGLSLKPSGSMETMKMDMAGSASVLGVFSRIVALNPNVEVHGIFAACENMPGPNAIKPGDVVHAMNKKTIEILNTDAEGRVTLADALTYATKQKPDLIIDLATLTGACVVALGEEVAGVMSNHPKQTNDLLDAAYEAGEKMWQLPLEPRYNKLIESKIADVKNIGGRYGGALTAGLFLQMFVGDTPWIHIDIAGPSFAERPLNAYTEYGGSGFAVRTLIEYLRSI